MTANLPTNQKCSTCGGSGWATHIKPDGRMGLKCPTCHDTGTVPSEPTAFEERPITDPSVQAALANEEYGTIHDMKIYKSPQPAPDSPDDELTQILDSLATQVHNLSPGDVGSMDRVLRPIAEAHAAIEALYAARFERALLKLNIATTTDDAVELIRTRYYQGDGK